MEKLLVFLNLLGKRAVFAEKLHHVLQVGVSLCQLTVLLLVIIDGGIGESLLQFHVFFSRP